MHINQNMCTLEKRLREAKERQNPSFSSTLLDEIYRSIDDDKGGKLRKEDMNFYRETMGKKQSTRDGHHYKANQNEGEVEEMMKIQHAKLVEKYMVKKKVSDHEQDALFFSSASSSFDSSSGGFSSSDTESLHGSKPAMSCFIPTRPKPVRTTMPIRSEKKKKQEKALKTERTLFQKRRSLHTFDDSAQDQKSRLDESIINSKSSSLKINTNLKKVKQPISPGGRLTNFLSNLFTPGHTKKSRHPSSVGGYVDERGERGYNSEQVTTCSSASSFARSCLSKNSPSTREKLRNANKRSVRFCPVSVIVDKDSRHLMPVSVPTAWRIGKSPLEKVEKDVKHQVMARDFLKDYHQAVNHKKNDTVLRAVMHDQIYRHNEDGVEDAASCSSSDLFELDRLSVTEKDRYHEELPVYETTSVNTNRAISSLIM